MNLFGAVGILDKELIESVLGDNDAYIIPSSVHQLIICPVTDDISASDFAKMIISVNDSVLYKKEILSDHPYLYSGVDHNIICA